MQIDQFENFIFDMDGTLINSSEEVLCCFKKAFAKANYQIDTNRLSSDLIGPPLKQIIKNIASELHNENKIDEIISKFRAIYDYKENDISVMYDGMYDFLINLKNQNKRLFIATFKPYIPTLRLINKFNLDMFEDIYTIDKFEKPITKSEILNKIINKYNLINEKTVMIGDSSSDMIAAKENNIAGIGVLWGYGKDKRNLIKNATCTINDISSLYKRGSING